MDNVPFLIFLEIAVDFWLEDHFAKAQQDPEVEDFVQTSTPVIDLVYVTSEHPTYAFQVGDLVSTMILFVTLNLLYWAFIIVSAIEIIPTLMFFACDNTSLSGAEIL
jgi:hypothetical protein